jgi:membrane-associated PAP2 superfamily phosphatase
MNRTGLMIALAVAAIAGIVLGAVPALDLKISGLLFDSDTKMFRLSHLMAVGHYGWLGTARDAGMWVIAALAAPAVVALIGKIIRPRAAMAIPGRAVVHLLVTLALAPGLMANVLLKDHWGRPRPIDVQNFAGTDRFVAWWDPRGECPQNCSFVSGESSGAFWAFAPASLAPAPLRPLAYAAAIAFGTAVGTLRMAYGGHFLTDVVFAGVFTFLIVWLMHRLLYGLRPGALSDAAIEAAIERLAAPFHRAPGSAGANGSAPRPSGGSG